MCRDLGFVRGGGKPEISAARGGGTPEPPPPLNTYGQNLIHHFEFSRPFLALLGLPFSPPGRYCSTANTLKNGGKIQNVVSRSDFEIFSPNAVILLLLITFGCLWYPTYPIHQKVVINDKGSQVICKWDVIPIT